MRPGESSVSPLERRAVRALLLTPNREILLMRIEIPVSAQSLWIAPGGGLGTGEDASTALARELREETGLETCVAGRAIWRRSHVFEFEGRWLRQVEEFRVVRTERFEPCSDLMPEEDVEREMFRELRWWSAAELRTTTERLVPAELSRHLDALLDHGEPREPIDVGV